MVNMDLLKDKIKEKGLSMSEISDKMDISRSTLYRKINNEGETFLVREVTALAEILDVEPDEFNYIFLTRKPHKCD